jgi:hypothetical protein
MSALPGSLLAAALRAKRGALAPGAPTQGSPPPDRARQGSLDPQTVAEFIAYDIPVATPPAVSFTFPAQVRRG